MRINELHQKWPFHTVHSNRQHSHVQQEKVLFNTILSLLFELTTNLIYTKKMLLLYCDSHFKREKKPSKQFLHEIL